MKKVFHILKGWGKAMGIVSISRAEEKLSDLRLGICNICQFSEESKVLSIINGEDRYENILKCTKCGCPCVEKTLVVDEQCPIRKW